VGKAGDAAARLTAGLEELGCHVTAACDAAEALERLRELCPQVILLDATAGTADGFGLCRHLQANVETKDIPVLLLAGATESIDRAQALEAGALDFIADPLDKVELRARVTSALRLKRLEDELRDASVKDALTGLLSRAFFQEQFERECNRSRRYESLFALVVVELDHFRQINERHGRKCGDQVLRNLASILQETTRESDYVARWGRDAFMVLLPEADLRRATGFARKLFGQIAEHHFSCGGEGTELTVSMGIASRQNLGGKDPAEMLPLAIASLQAAKRAGGDRIFYHTCGQYNLVRM
jgi:diguanylate cyclase (GGDEF)-like protein